MPSITYENEEQPQNEDENAQKELEAPEPPIRYDGNASQIPVYFDPGNRNPIEFEFEKTRRLITVAQIMALVSLVIGGIFLSGAAVIVAVVAQRKVAARRMQGDTDAAVWELLGKRAIVAIVMAVLALGVNIAAFVYVYPIVMGMMQTGDYTALFGGGQGFTPSGGNGSSFWG